VPVFRHWPKDSAISSNNFPVITDSLNPPQGAYSWNPQPLFRLITATATSTSITPELAAELTSTLALTYRGKGNIFIHTANLTSVASESQVAFADHLSLSGLPREHLYLTGIKGLEISPDKGRVIVYEKKEKGCCGRCRDCKCDDK
jgi:hypothetical protein